MRILISVWACLALFFVNNSEAATSIEKITSSVVVSEGDEKSKTEVKVMEFMTGRKLQLILNPSSKKLLVNLSGADEKLEWIIFQPKGKVISRISTSSKIDEIEIDNLETGKYVLMIKDASGRTLFQAFDKK